MSLLKNPEILQKIKDKLCWAKRQDSNCPIEKWIAIKKHITDLFKKLSRSQADDDRVAIGQLCEKLTEMEETMPLNEHEMELYWKMQMDMNDLQMKRAESLIFRSKVRWYEYGEKGTKYFYNLEKARANQKTCTKIIHEGEELCTDESILNAQFTYFQNLYKRDDSLKYTIENRSGIKLSQAHFLQCERKISESEAKAAVWSIKTSKTPGIDGLPIELYKILWNDLKDVFMDMIHESERTGYIHHSIKSGVLNLIPKANKDSRFLRNLRPITLLNVDYKIIEKILARRLDNVLPSIINKDQTGFMAGRRISVNIRKVFDIMQHCRNQEIDGVLLNLDYMKCFDNISFDCILGSMRYFNIPEYMINWIEMLYTDFSIKVQNNGKFTQSIDVQKSVHQGGCVSVQIFC